MDLGPYQRQQQESSQGGPYDAGHGASQSQGGSGQHCSPPTQSSRWSAPRCLGFEREERHESCGTACSSPHASPSRGKAPSLYREPLMPSSMLFFILCRTTTC